MKMIACTAIACTGMMATHHCFVRHQKRATKSTHAPMMNSVVPIAEKAAVTEFSAGVRIDTNQRFTACSPGQSSRGPTMSRPTPTTTTQRATAGSEDPDRDVAECCPAGRSRRVELVAVQEGVHHDSWSGATADQPL